MNNHYKAMGAVYNGKKYIVSKLVGRSKWTIWKLDHDGNWKWFSDGFKTAIHAKRRAEKSSYAFSA